MFRLLTTALLAALLWSGAAVTTLAAEDHSAKDDHSVKSQGAEGAAKDKHAKDAHAPPNPVLPRADLGIWALVVFVLLLVVLQRTAWPQMLEGLQKRESTIRDSLEEARRTRDEMAGMQAQFAAERQSAQQQIHQMLDEARLNATKVADEMVAKANADIQAEKQRARRELEVARDQAVKELWSQSAQLASLISAKAIGRSLSEDDHRRLIDEALNEIASH